MGLTYFVMDRNERAVAVASVEVVPSVLLLPP